MNAETQKLMTEAADRLEGLTGQLKSAQAQVSEQAKEIKALKGQAKAAADKSAVNLAPLAKAAADMLLEHGLVANEQRRDQAAAALTDHKSALTILKSAAAKVTLPKIGQVVEDQQSLELSSDDVWGQHLSKHTR